MNSIKVKKRRNNLFISSYMDYKKNNFIIYYILFIGLYVYSIWKLKEKDKD